MIDVKQLKIGNLFYDDCDSICIVTGFKPLEHSTRCDEEEGCIILFDYFKDGTLNKGYELESEECSPMPLSEEWLERLGFQHMYSHRWQHPAGIDLDMGIAGGYVLLCEERCNWGIEYDYVHQIQNLCSILTTKELTIKEPIK